MRNLRRPFTGKGASKKEKLIFSKKTNQIHHQNIGKTVFAAKEVFFFKK